MSDIVILDEEQSTLNKKHLPKESKSNSG